MKLTVYTYNLPFAQPLTTNKGTFHNRQGLIIAYTTDDFEIYAEAAPLPGFSTENISLVQEQMQQLNKTILKSLSSDSPIKSLRALYEKKVISASLRFAMDTISYQLEAMREHTSLSHLMYQQPLQVMPLNALISLNRPDLFNQVEKFVSNGFTTLKVKIGRDFKEEYLKLQKICYLYPDLMIRLDANQAWSPNEAIQNLKRLQNLAVEYCEEPLQEVSEASLKKIISSTAVPIALDESLQQSSWKKFLPYIAVVILKPMVLGDFSNFFVTKRFAKSHGIKTVVTTSMETAVGRTITAILASGIKAPEGLAHGLNTGDFLAMDIFDDSPSIYGGQYHLEKQSLLDRIDRNYLQSIATNIITYS